MIIALTGAGISKASGIPTFEDQGDLREKLSRTFAMEHPEQYHNIIEQMTEVCSKAEPNDAHIALSDYNIPVITMNIDGLHRRAGSKDILAIHGELPNIVLYGDPAPRYSKAYDWVQTFGVADILLIIGTSFYTNIASELKFRAELLSSKVVIINSDAENETRKFLEENKDSIESMEVLLSRID